MPIIEKPQTKEDLNIDSDAISDEMFALENEDDSGYGGLEPWIREKYHRASEKRDSDEQRWLQSYRNYRGVYGDDVKFTDSEKSRAFIKITKTKVLASYAQIVDVLFAGSKFPIAITPTKNPIGDTPEAVYFDEMEITEENVASKVPNPVTGKPEVSGPKNNVTRPSIAKSYGPYQESLERVDEFVQEGYGKTPTAATFEPILEAARNMEKRIHDQLEESEASKHLRNVAFEMALFGTGILKGPFAFDKEYPRWQEDGEYSPIFETIPRVESVSIWDVFPDPDAHNMSEAEYMIQRHRMSRSQLRALKNRPYFRKDAIESSIEMGPSYNSEYWEDVLEDSEITNQSTRYEVLEYWGVLDAQLAEEAGLEIPESLAKKDQVDINAWVCNGNILRLVLNPFTPSRIPYHAVPYELNPYSFFGIGVAENMEDTQLLMNGFMRMAIDNAALSSNLLIEVDETNLIPGQDMSIYPGKIFRRQAGAPGQAIFGTKFPNVTNECLQMFDKTRQLADESTGIPSYSHGMTGVMGVGRTASGMSMLMGAAAQNIKAVVRNIDDYLLGPLGKSFFAFNMQFKFDPNANGDLDIEALGTESLMRNEIRSQKLMQFMQIAQNPAMAPFVKYDYVLREIAASMDLDEDKILNDPREAEIQAKIAADYQKVLMENMPEEEKQAPPQQDPNAILQALMGGAPPQEGGPPPLEDPTGIGGTVQPGAAPEPGAEGFAGNTGGGEVLQ
jgi:hypothetical protein